MTKDTIKMQKFMIPFRGHMYAKSYIRSEKEEKVFSLDSTIIPDIESANPILEIRYKKSSHNEFPRYNMERQMLEKIHAHDIRNVYEFDIDNYTINFPENGNGRISNVQKSYNNLLINALYKRAKIVEEYSPKEMKGMVKSTVTIPIEKKK